MEAIDLMKPRIAISPPSHKVSGYPLAVVQSMIWVELAIDVRYYAALIFNPEWSRKHE